MTANKKRAADIAANANARAGAGAHNGNANKGESYREKNAVAKTRRNKRTRPLGGRLVYRGGFPVFAARYVLFGGDTPRAAVRFYNGSDVLLTGLRFLVTEIDGDGKTIAEYTISRRGLNAESGAEFAVADFAVSVDCASLEIKTQSAISEPYEYVTDGDSVHVKYGVEKEKEEFYFSKKPAHSVKKRKRTLAIIAAVALLVVVLAATCTAWRLGVFNGDLSRTSADGGAYISVMQNVEA